MEVKQAYAQWAEQYDTNLNKTRDLEAISLQKTLEPVDFMSCLEIGCGTGKNTRWLAEKTRHLTAVDLTEEMLQKAKEKVQESHVQFMAADITHPWDFCTQTYDLVTFSLVLEHIEDIHAIFKKVALVTNPGAHVYVGELHPFRQYGGSKARFETEDGTTVVTCFTHHLSEFTGATAEAGFVIERVNEFFDEDDRTKVPRILTLLFRRAEA
jgi:ubiquinone/menaquinone biosynthesis C-methylase UbiE